MAKSKVLSSFFFSNAIPDDVTESSTYLLFFLIAVKEVLSNAIYYIKGFLSMLY